MGGTPTGAGQHHARHRFATATAAAVAVAIALGLVACSSSSERARTTTSRPSSSAGTYGALPTFLPTPTIQADAPVTGSPGSPAVTSQGDTVIARLPGGTVHAGVLGPIVPGEGLPKVQDYTTATWTVTLTDATTTVPVRVADFVALDDQGDLYRPQLVPGTTRPPSVLRPGQRTSFRLRVVMATGEGVMRWQPNGHLLAVWDFVVEND